MEKIEIVVNPLSSSNLSCVVEEGRNTRKSYPVDVAIEDVEKLSVRRKGSQANNVASVRIVPLHLLHMVAPVFNVPAEEVERFTEELKEEFSQKGEPLPEYVAVYSLPSSFQYKLAVVEQIRTPFLSEGGETPEFDAKKQLKAYETPDEFMVPAFRLLGRAMAESYVRIAKKNVISSMSESRLLSRIVDFPKKEKAGEMGLLYSATQQSESKNVLMTHEEFLEALRRLDPSSLGDDAEEVELELGDGTKVVVKPEDVGARDGTKETVWQTFLRQLRLWSERVKVLSEYERDVTSEEGSPFDVIRAMVEDKNLSSFLRGSFSKYPEIGVVDFQAGSGGHLRALNEVLNADAKLFGTELREIPPQERVGGDKNLVQYGVDCLLFFPEWNEEASKRKNEVTSTFYYLNPPYMNDRTISMRSVTSIPEGAITLGLFSTKDEKLLRSNFEGFLVKIPVEMTGYTDPENPRYFLALVGVKKSGEGNPVYLDLEGQEGRFSSFTEVVEHLISEHPEVWDGIVAKAGEVVNRLNSPSLKTPYTTRIGETIEKIVRKIKGANVEKWRERFSGPEETFKTLSRVLSLDANAMRGERVFPDLRVVGTTRLLTIDEVLSNLHLLSFYRDAYPEWYEMARRVAEASGRPFPDVGSAEEKEVVVSENLGILKYKFLPKVLPLTEEVKEAMRELFYVPQYVRGIPDRYANEYAKLEDLLERGERLVIKTKMEAISVGGDATFGYTPVIAVEDSFGRHLGVISLPIAEFYQKLEEKGIVNPRERYEVATPDGEIMKRLVERYVEHVRAIAREHFGVDEEKENRIREELSRSKRFTDFQRNVLSILSEEGNFPEKVVEILKTQVLSVTDVREELIRSVYTLLSSLGQKEVAPPLAGVIEEVAKWYKEVPFVFLSTRTPEDVETYRNKLETEEEVRAYSSLPWVAEGRGSEEWVISLIEAHLEEGGKRLPEDVIEDLKNTIFQTLSEHSALEDGVRQGAERFIQQYLYTYVLEVLLERAKRGDERSAQELKERMRKLFVGVLGIMPHQYDEAINLLAKKVRTGERGHLLGWEMRSGKTLAMSLMGYFNALYFGKDVYMFPKNANMLDIIYQIATFTPQVAFNLRAYRSGDVELGLSEDRVSDIISSDVYPNVFSFRAMNGILVGAGKTAELLLENYAKDVEELMSLYEGKPSEELEREIERRKDEGKPYSEVLSMEGFSPQVRLALYDYFAYLEKNGYLKDLRQKASRQALGKVMKGLENLSKRLSSAEERGRERFFTFHLVPKYHLFAVQYRIPGGEKDLSLGGNSVVFAGVTTNKDLHVSKGEEVDFESFKKNLISRFMNDARPLESFGQAGHEFLRVVLENVVNYVKNEEEFFENPHKLYDVHSVTGVYADPDELAYNFENLANEGIVEPVRDALVDLMMEADREGNEELVELLSAILKEEEEEEEDLFKLLLTTGLGIATERIGEIKPASSDQPVPLTTSYLSFTFSDGVAEALSSRGIEVSEESRRRIEEAVNDALMDSEVLKEPDGELLRAYSVVSTPVILSSVLLRILNPENALKHKKNFENEMGYLYGSILLKATSPELLYREAKSISAELTLRIPSGVFDDGLPFPDAEVSREKKVVLAKPGRNLWKEGGDKGFVPYGLGWKDEVVVRIKGKGRVNLTYELRISDPTFPEAVRTSSSNATNYFVHSRFFREKEPVSIIDEADESTKPNAKGYLSFYYIARNSSLAVASTGTPTSGDVATPVALIGLVSALPLPTIERSVSKAVEDFAVFSVKEEKTVPYLILNAALSFNTGGSAGDKDTFFSSLVTNLIEPLLEDKLTNEGIVERFVELIDSANRAGDGSILDPNVDYKLEKIRSGDVPHYLLATELKRFAINFNRWFSSKWKNLSLQDVARSPDVFKDLLISFYKEKGIASISPGTYDPIGFVSMLSNASLLTRETLKKAIDPEIEETKDYKDLSLFTEILEAQSQGTLGTLFPGTAEEVMEEHSVAPSLRALWDDAVARYRTKTLLSEFYSLYVNNLEQLISAISRNPEPFLREYVRKNEEGVENGSLFEKPELAQLAVSRVLDLNKEEHADLLRRYVLLLAEKRFADGASREEVARNVEGAFRDFTSYVEKIPEDRRKVKGVSYVFLEDGQPVINVHFAWGHPEQRVDEGYAINVWNPWFSEPGSIYSPSSNLSVASTYVDPVYMYKAVWENAGLPDGEPREEKPEIPEMSEEELRSLLEKSSKTRNDSVLDVLKAYVARNFDWTGLEREYGEEKVAVARAVMHYFTKNFLYRIADVYDEKKAWEKREEGERNDGEKEAFRYRAGGYEIIPYLPDHILSPDSPVAIDRVLPSGQMCVLVSDKETFQNLLHSTGNGIRFSKEVEFHREEWDVLKKDESVSFVIPYRLKYLVDEENEIVDMFANKGLRERIRGLVKEGKNFIVAPSRKKVMSFALLDTLSDLYLEQKRRMEEGEETPTYHVLVRVTDKEHVDLINKIDRESLEEVGIVLKVFHHHTELDMEAKKLRSILREERKRGEDRTRMVVIAPAGTVSRGVDFSMLDEMVVPGTLSGNGRDFSQLLARLYNNKDKHHAEISMFGIPIRYRPSGEEELSIAVNHSSLVQLKLLKKEEFIRAVMSGKIANVLSRNTFHVISDRTPERHEIERAKEKLIKLRERETEKAPAEEVREEETRDRFRSVSPSL